MGRRDGEIRETLSFVGGGNEEARVVSKDRPVNQEPGGVWEESKRAVNATSRRGELGVRWQNSGTPQMVEGGNHTGRHDQNRKRGGTLCKDVSSKRWCWWKRVILATSQVKGGF